MKHILILLAMMIVLWGCTQKPVDESKFPGTGEYIQAYANANISPKWFSGNKPAGKLEITEVQILKILPSKDNDNTALVTVLLKGDSFDSENESNIKKFSLRKDFNVTRDAHGGYSVRSLSGVN
jgi:hypothetical protein